jgi:hypothetical protein
MLLHRGTNSRLQGRSQRAATSRLRFLYPLMLMSHKIYETPSNTLILLHLLELSRYRPLKLVVRKPNVFQGRQFS